jgi:hypothetical protein
MNDNLTNARRAKRCEKLLRRYDADSDLTTNLIDLLADARHWCDANDEDFYQLDRRAHAHYLDERDEEGRV